jgi:hypothetical protein
MRISSIVMIAVVSIGVRMPVNAQILPPDKLLKLIPNKITGFYLSTDPQSKQIKLGTLQYCMAEKDFAASRKRSVKILLFDYKEAPIMYNQATRKWATYKTIESDTIIQRPVKLNECTGWESYHAGRMSSQILIGIFNRFYLTVEGTNVDLESLNKILQEFKLDSFPK